jgi:ubiquitin carboxyl-terminal hydrolase 34
MIPAYRYSLLSVDDGSPEDLQKYKGRMVDDNVLHQLQKVFVNLEISERQFYDTIDFCFSFKVDGQPTILNEQKDALEYINLKFDKIESLLKNTPQKYLI